MNKIIYNNIELPSPTPFVTLEKDYIFLGRKEGDDDKITLKGQLTGDFNKLISGQANLINIFSKNFGIFKITESSSTIYEKSGIILNDISFEESKYNGIIDYTINLTSKKTNQNVIEPENIFDFSEDENRILNLNHTISAKGLNTNPANLKSNALDNAIDFVKSFSGLANVPTTNFFNQKNNIFSLKTQGEKIDRLNNKYSITETYTNDLSTSSPTEGVCRYSVELQSGANEDFISLRLNGSIEGSLTGNVNSARSKIDPLLFINDYVLKYNINTTPLSYSLDENPGNKDIKFSYEFDNSPFPNPHAVYSISCQEDRMTQIVRIGINIRVKARGNLNTRKNLLASFYPTSYVARAFETYINILNRAEISSHNSFRLVRSQSKTNLDNSEMTWDIEYDNKNVLSEYYDSTYEVSQIFPQSIIQPEPTCNRRGIYAFVDLDVVSNGRIQVSFNGEAEGGGSASQIKSLFGGICDPRYAIENFSTSRQTVSYSCESIYQGPSFLPIIQ